MDNHRNFSDEELQDRMTVLLEDTAKIRYQLEEAKSIVAEGGEYSDSEWFRKATFALRMKGVEQQVIQMEFARRKRQRQNNLEQSFIKAAKSILEPDLFQEIMDEAKDNADYQ